MEAAIPGCGSAVAGMEIHRLTTAWQVDKAILSEEERLVAVRFGKEASIQVQQMDAILEGVAPLVQNFAVVYLVDTGRVPDFDLLYELYDEVTLMVFWRGRHMMIDLGTGNNNKITWVLKEKQELIDILEVTLFLTGVSRSCTKELGREKAWSSLPKTTPLNINIKSRLFKCEKF